MNTSKVVTVFIQSKYSCSEQRFDKSITIQDLKSKLILLTGLKNPKVLAKELGIYLEDSRMLGFYPIQDYHTLVIEGDNSEKHLDFNDVSTVQKFELSEKEYDNRKDSVREFKKLNKIGRFSDQVKVKDDFAREAEGIQVGQRY